jgi:1-acyl-sn-glycerol-3-phosphate acyltransferase
MWQVLRSIYIWFSIAFGTALMYVLALPVFLVTMPFDRKRAFGHWYAQRWGRLILKLNNRWSTEVRGQERIPKGRPYVIVSNHQGSGDIMMAFTLDHHFKWISKAANFYVPFMGWFMYHAGYIPLVRGRRNSIEQCMARAQEYLNMGVSVLFFPEGTRSLDGVVKPFKKGAFKLAIDAGVDILPMAINGTLDALPKNTWKFSDEYVTMRILVGDPISTRGMSEDDLDALIEQSREAVIDLKDELDGRTYARPLRAAG